MVAAATVAMEVWWVLDSSSQGKAMMSGNPELTSAMSLTAQRSQPDASDL